ncbi:MAG: DUF2200 domain-containing protein [Propionibacteriaceae bacterium]|jgi:hypothetical protein|nr:DUF2200 domain-containing protein [Propionibacteriaceae bacterium]
MRGERLFSMPFASLYQAYVAKAERKGRSQAEVDEVVCWLTGYDSTGLREAVAEGVSLRDFFTSAPAPNPKAELITGVVCGVRVEDVEDPLMRDIRRLDKLVDELAKGKPLEKIKRA